jgi:hypothetical protein
MRGRRLALALSAIALVAAAGSSAARPSFQGSVAPVSAALAGTKLTVNGTFDGMHSAATVAHLHLSKATGVPGPVIHELTVAKAMDGTISGSADLTPVEVDHVGVVQQPSRQQAAA